MPETPGFGPGLRLSILLVGKSVQAVKAHVWLPYGGYMASFSLPSRNQVNRAGKTLRQENAEYQERDRAIDILSHWRSAHSQPIRTFRTWLDKTLARHEKRPYIIAQRLKRLPSIVQKLQRYPQMGLERMQDIGGLRVILKSNTELEWLYNAMRKSGIGHEPVLPPDDYIASPKPDGYRSLHQVYKYASRTHPELNGLCVEIQLRTRLQHSWATAVETLGLLEKASFKTGEGSEHYREFFRLSSALHSIEEKKPVLEDYAFIPKAELVEKFLAIEAELAIFKRLEGAALSAKHIETSDRNATGYHLMVLDTKNNRLELMAYEESKLEFAERAYRDFEKEYRDDPTRSVVLISAGDVKEIRKAYPNYFLDTRDFIKKLSAICGK